MKIRQAKEARCSLKEITEKLRELLNSRAYKERSRKEAKHFTRERKMSFVSMMCFMLNQVKQSTQTALDHYYGITREGKIHMSQQSFSEARQKLRWEACRELMDATVDSVYDKGHSRWLGYRVTAIDSTLVQLPIDEKLRKMFGTTGRGNTAVTGRSSCMYDVLNDIIIDARLKPIGTGEREMAKEHVEHLRNMPSFGKDISIMDRGYVSIDLIEYIESKGVTYLMRVRRRFKKDIDELPLGDHRYTLREDGKEIPARVIKFCLPSGEIETLITNLFDKRLGENAFKELYFKRWPVETKYAELKHKLEIENFSGRTEEAIYQDFYISAFLSNMIAIAANETQPVIDQLHKDKDNRYDYKANKNHAVGVFKDRFIQALLEDRPRKRDRAVNIILALLFTHLTPIRPGRSIPRNPHPRVAHHHFNQKSNC